MALIIRVARPSDAAGIRAIYAPMVNETAISFEQTAPSVEEVERRASAVLPTHPWLVCATDGGQVTGYAYAGPFRSRDAYRWSTEVSAYVAPDHRGLGIATALYEALFDVLRHQNFVRAVAGITLPNEASVRLHERLGFEALGVYRSVGFKHGEWHDVGWWQRALRERPRTPEEPVPFAQVASSETVTEILRDASARVTGSRP